MPADYDHHKRIGRLIEFFKKFRSRSPKPDKPDYSRWNQTEEAYQKEQAEWLASRRRKKGAKQQEKKKDADQQGD